MVTIFSAISIQDRFEIQDVLSRFCHTLDRNERQAWMRLFRPDAVICAPRLGTFVGLEAISKIPETTAALGGGAWRHYLNNVAMSGISHRLVQADAYCLVSNWRAGGQIVRSWDVRAMLAKSKEWQIAELALTPVTGAASPAHAEGGPAEQRLS